MYSPAEARALMYATYKRVVLVFQNYCRSILQYRLSCIDCEGDALKKAIRVKSKDDADHRQPNKSDPSRLVLCYLKVFLLALVTEDLHVQMIRKKQSSHHNKEVNKVPWGEGGAETGEV